MHECDFSELWECVQIHLKYLTVVNSLDCSRGASWYHVSPAQTRVVGHCSMNKSEGNLKASGFHHGALIHLPRPKTNDVGEYIT